MRDTLLEPASDWHYWGHNASGARQRLRVLGGLSAPSGPEVRAVVDVLVIGGRGDGKTQLLRCLCAGLDAVQAEGLNGEESRLSDMIVAGALDQEFAERTPGSSKFDHNVFHHVVQVPARELVASTPFEARIRGAVTGVGVRGVVGFVGVLVVVVAALAAMWLNTASAYMPIRAAASVPGAIALIALLGRAFDTIRGGMLTRDGLVEFVFWDIAGESLAGENTGRLVFHKFVQELVKLRAERSTPWAVLPILVCNPVRLDGTDFYGGLREFTMRCAAAIRNRAESAEILHVTNREELISRLKRFKGEDRAIVISAPVGAAAGEPRLTHIADLIELTEVSFGLRVQGERTQITSVVYDLAKTDRALSHDNYNPEWLLGGEGAQGTDSAPSELRFEEQSYYDALERLVAQSPDSRIVVHRHQRPTIKQPALIRRFAGLVARSLAGPKRRQPAQGSVERRWFPDEAGAEGALPSAPPSPPPRPASTEVRTNSRPSDHDEDTGSMPNV